MTDRPLRIAILWKQMSGYFDTLVRELQARPDTEVWLAYRRALDDAPFDDDALPSTIGGFGWTGRPGTSTLRRHLDAFSPDVVIVSSWDIDDYRREVRRLRGRAVRALFMDNQWLATPKQRLGVAMSGVYVRPAFDIALVPGQTQADFAQRLGYDDSRIIRGMYCGDQPTFDAVAEARSRLDHSFLFVGRLVPEKGVDLLAEAYSAHRRVAGAGAWPLRLAGTGPLGQAFAGIDGVEELGFVQPGELPAVFAESGCLVLPSRFEPWGMVLHEAAAAGLPLIASAACGATTRLLQDGYNGILLPTGSVDALAAALTRMSHYGDDRRAEMGEASRSLARQFTPKRWAQHLTERLVELRPAVLDD
jgi:glycosyltransferase involved in cell wall biosynthesis